ncbi:MAG: methyltransferase domain-containing protein [bacterium]
MDAEQARMVFSLVWQSPSATHRDRTFFPKINFWRDLLPGQMDRHLDRFVKAGQYSESFEAGTLVAPFDPKKVIRCPLNRIHGKQKDTSQRIFSRGRFYPRGLLSGIGFSPQDTRPFRVQSSNDAELLVDTNHPLAPYPLIVAAELVETLNQRHQRGGSSLDIGQSVADNGPGLQGVQPESPPDFLSGDPFDRLDPEADTLFYQHPRLVNHIDQEASRQIAAIYGRLLKPGMTVLDLMAAWNSHLNPDNGRMSVTGLGLNRVEQEENPNLSDIVCQDLNRNPQLPFGSETFDACICTVSVEYLIDPVPVFEAVGRILKKGAPFVITFSDRWFDTKVIRLWTELHPFERMALVVTYFMDSGMFDGLQTESIRGYPRSREDKYYPERQESDPVFAVWGFRK